MDILEVVTFGILNENKKYQLRSWYFFTWSFEALAFSQPPPWGFSYGGFSFSQPPPWGFGFLPAATATAAATAAGESTATGVARTATTATSGIGWGWAGNTGGKAAKIGIR